MSSALPTNPYSSTGLVYGGAKDAGVGDEGGSPSFQLTARQQWLTWLWGFYKCTNYADRKWNFDGSEAHGHIEHNAIATEGYIPPGFYDTGGSTIPVEYRKPLAPYYLVREIDDRFTNLLFSEGRTPTISVDGDDDSSDYYTALAEEGHLWEQMTRARTFGGAMASVAMSFSLVDGKPLFEVHDSRWCNPTFEAMNSPKLKRFEKKYLYRDVLRNADDEPIRDADGREIEDWFWYRRLITADQDAIWERVPARFDEDPDWDMYEARVTDHNLGIVPVVWIRNLPVEDGLDGEPDAAGVHELIQAYDVLMSAAQSAAKAAANPQLGFATDEELSDVSRSVKDALKVMKDGKISTIEFSGTGAKACMEVADKIREIAFEIAAVVPDTANALMGGKKTATEVLALFSRMLEKASRLRNNYGDAVVALLEIADQAIRQASKPRLEKKTLDDGAEVNQLVQGTIDLPPRVEKQTNGGTSLVQRKLGAGGKIRLTWPRFFEPTLDDILKACQAVAQAMTVGAIDDETAANFLKNYLPIKDIPTMLENIKKNKQVQAESIASQALKGGFGGSAGKGVKVQ